MGAVILVGALADQVLSPNSPTGKALRAWFEREVEKRGRLAASLLVAGIVIAGGIALRLLAFILVFLYNLVDRH
jgi:hypothetical protein